MNRPYPPTPPQKFLGGEEISRQKIDDGDDLPVLDQENFDYAFETDKLYYSDHSGYYDYYLIQRTKVFENVNYPKELAAYKRAKQKYSEDYKKWKTFDSEQKKKAKEEKAKLQKDQEYKTYLKLKKRYEQ